MARMPLGVLVLAMLALAGCKSSGSPSNAGGCSKGCCPGNIGEPAASVPVAANQPILASPATNYGGQKTCPVTGDELGSMGPAIPVTVKGQTIYVCCRGCARRVEREPDTFLRKVEAERNSQ